MADLPYPFFDAIRAGLAFLGYEELPTEERPPRHIWLHAESMQAWWEQVEREREEKYGTGGGDSHMESSGLADDLVVG